VGDLWWGAAGGGGSEVWCGCAAGWAAG
jgi:hypothetical protein